METKPPVRIHFRLSRRAGIVVALADGASPAPSSAREFTEGFCELSTPPAAPVSAGRATTAALRGCRHGRGAGDVDFYRSIGRDVVAHVNVEALILACGGDARAGNLYGGRRGDDQALAGIGRDVVQRDVIACVGNFVGKAHAAFARAERKGDRHLIFAFVYRALHYWHAGRAPGGGLIEIGAIRKGEIEGAIGAIERERRLGFICDHIFFADHQVRAVWLEDYGVIRDVE